MKLVAKHTELVQLIHKFMPRSHDVIFRNKSTWSTPLDFKLMFWCVSYYLGAFGTVWLPTKLGAKRAEVVQKFVPWSRVGIFRNERARSTLLDHYLMFRCVSYYLGAFRTVCCITTISSKRAKLVQKFMPRSRVGIFRNERARSTTLDPKLMFCCDSYNLGAFRTIWLLNENRCKTGRTSTKVRATKSRRNFSQRTHLMFWCVLYYLGVFGNVWLPHETRCKTGRTSAKVRATKSRPNFSQRTHSIDPIWR